MRIAFDAKRALNNATGLGNHARILLNAMMRDFPKNEYLLFSPKVMDEFLHQLNGDFKTFYPQPKLYRSLPAFWRSWGVTEMVEVKRADIYHGLSNELPFNIHHSNIKTVVTIHDLIFLKHTEQYPWIDRQFYKLKTKYAVKHADKVIAVSNETKHDLMETYKVPEDKIVVIYPSVDPIFYENQESRTRSQDNKKKYILNVSSFYTRKNQKTLIEAYALIEKEIEEELWLVGSSGNLKKEIEQSIYEKGLEKRVRILSNIANEELPTLYRSASVFVFPSLFEGFGAPVLEALFSGTPVIATKGGAIEEAAGSGSVLINPNSFEDIADKMLKVLKTEALRGKMREDSLKHAQGMTDKVFAGKTIQLYNGLIN